MPATDAGLLLDQPLRISPLAWPLGYEWPVQLVGPGYQPEVLPNQPTLLLVPREEDWSVKFSALSPLAWRLLQQVGEFPELTGRDQLQGLAEEAGQVGSSVFFEGGMGLLRQLHAERVIGIAVQTHVSLSLEQVLPTNQEGEGACCRSGAFARGHARTNR